MKKSLTYLTLLVLTLFYACNGSKPAAEEALPPYINVSYTVPKDLPSDASPELLAKFAWEELVALNWKSSFNSSQRRGQPDTTWNFGQSGAYPDLLVWETYAHRSELRPYYGQIQPFDNPPHYSFGNQPAPLPGTNARFDLFNNLDESNEIGSCNLYAYDTSQMVLYQAKVNRYEYDYIQQYYGDSTSLAEAATRTQNNISNLSAYCPECPTNCDCPPEAGVICLPCGGAENEGSIEVKTAWRMLTDQDDHSRFYKDSVIYYEKGANGEIYYKNGVFGLIGIHIIHKTENYPTFIFASWEQVDVTKANMEFILLNGSAQPTGAPQTVERLHGVPPVIDTVNNNVHALLKKINMESIWQYYRLIGVQSRPVNSIEEDPNYYMANFVIESDSTLANFHGSSIGKPFDGGKNTLYNKTFYNMGGCMGCHGATQLKGTDFSFLLDFAGKPVKDPDVIDLIPTEPSPKVKAYILGIQ